MKLEPSTMRKSMSGHLLYTSTHGRILLWLEHDVRLILQNTRLSYVHLPPNCNIEDIRKEFLRFPP